MVLTNKLELQPNEPFTFPQYKTFIQELRTLRGEYRNSVSIRRREDLARLYQLEIEIPQVYRAKLPLHLLARCPICGGSVREAVDIFSLSGPGWWLSESRGFGWYGRQIKMPSGHDRPVDYNDRTLDPSYQTDCDHVQAVTYNINLNGIFPDDAQPQKYAIIGSESPQVLRPFMEQPGSYAVIHALPVGRLDDETWRPWYTVCFTSYFHSKPFTFHKALGGNPADLKNFFWPHHLLDFNMEIWLEAGQLYWLDWTTPDFPLTQSSQSFPYPNKTGLRGRWALLNQKIYLLPDIYVPKLKHPRKFPAQIQAQQKNDLETRELKHIQEIDRRQFHQTYFAWLPLGSKGIIPAPAEDKLSTFLTPRWKR